MQQHAAVVHMRHAQLGILTLFPRMRSEVFSFISGSLELEARRVTSLSFSATVRSRPNEWTILILSN